MLVISRVPDQGVWIGDVFVRVLGVRGNHVRIGIQADRSTEVVRDELIERKVHQKRLETVSQLQAKIEEPE